MNEIERNKKKENECEKTRARKQKKKKTDRKRNEGTCITQQTFDEMGFGPERQSNGFTQQGYFPFSILWLSNVLCSLA